VVTVRRARTTNVNEHAMHLVVAAVKAPHGATLR
jgi:hypothetical protein